MAIRASFRLNIANILFLVATLVACDNESIKSKDVTLHHNQIWQAAAYGLVLQINSGTHQWYQLTSEHCQYFELGVDHSALIDSVVMANDGQSMTTTVADLKVPGFAMSKLNALPDVCSTANIIANKGEAGYEFNAQRDFEIFWQTFKEHYAFFELESVDWDHIYQMANSQISTQTTEPELVDILIEMITPLKDFHVSIFNEKLGIETSIDRKTNIDDLVLQEFALLHQIEPPFDNQNLVIYEEYFDNAMDRMIGAISEYFLDDFEVQVNDTESIFWGRLEGNIGYINLLTMELANIGNSDNSIQQNKDLLNQTLNKILDDLTNVESVIIDVRLNGGGDDFVSRMIASRFYQKRVHVYSKQARLGEGRTPIQKVYVEPEGEKQFLGPVALLTSTSTSSAAEIFAIVMRKRANTILVGEATGGGLSDILPKSLPHGTEYSLSNEYYLTPAGELFEGSGVPVDIQQDFFTLNQRELGVDLAMQKSIDWLKSKVQDDE